VRQHPSSERDYVREHYGRQLSASGLAVMHTIPFTSKSKEKNTATGACEDILQQIYNKIASRVSLEFNPENF
jgi:hypothetical protein